MSSIVDDRGYNQGYKASKSVEIRTERRCDYIISRLELKGSGSASILEIGCGTGKHSYLLAKKTGKHFLGTDICGPFIEEARARYSLPNLEYKQLDFNSRGDVMKVLNGLTFDYIVGDGILHHLYDNLDNSLININKLLSPGGKIVFLEPNFYNPYCLLIFNIGVFRKLAKLEPGEMTFTPGFITKKLKNAGFSGVNIDFRDFLVPGIPDCMINPAIAVGNVIEKLPLMNRLSQSIFISAVKQQTSPVLKEPGSRP